MVDETLNGINEETLPAYEIAEGPEALAALLDKLLEKYHQKNDSSENEYYILYKIGEQRSLIKVDISTMPFYFWFYDLLARPPTSSVKEIDRKSVV